MVQMNRWIFNCKDEDGQTKTQTETEAETQTEIETEKETQTGTQTKTETETESQELNCQLVGLRVPSQRHDRGLKLIGFGFIRSGWRCHWCTLLPDSVVSRLRVSICRLVVFGGIGWHTYATCLLKLWSWSNFSLDWARPWAIGQPHPSLHCQLIGLRVPSQRKMRDHPLRALSFSLEWRHWSGHSKTLTSARNLQFSVHIHLSLIDVGCGRGGWRRTRTRARSLRLLFKGSYVKLNSVKVQNKVKVKV